MLTRVNGRAISDYKDFDVLENGLAVPSAEPLYTPAISNGYWPDDFIVDDSLVLNLDFALLKGDKFKSIDRYGHTCTPTNAVWKPDGRLFSGNGLIDCGNAASLQLVSSFTVEVIVKRGAINEYHVIASKYDTGSSERGWSFTFLRAQEDNVIEFAVSKDGTNLTSLATTASYTDTDALLHIIVAYNSITNGSSVMKIDVNGVEKATTSSAVSPLNDSADPVRVGVIQINNANTRFYVGTIKVLRLYSRFLSEAERRHNYKVSAWRLQ